jgi:nucleoside-diphosphate-sugar epimerase
VTGASGFIGGRVVERLALERVECVRALVRKWSRAARVAKFRIEIVAGDIMSASDAAAAMEGVTHVVHCAFGDAPEVIVEGTRTLLQAALDAGVTRFVYVSTAEVYGAQAAGNVDESTVTNHTGRTYGDAKIDAETLCREFGKRGLSTTIVRPAIVYGPFGRSWTVGVAKRLQSGLWSEFEGYGDGMCNAIYVDDLVSAILLAADHPDAAGETFNVNGGEVVTWNEYFRRMNSAMSLPPLMKRSASQSARRTALMGRVETVIRSLVGRFEDRLMEIYLRGGFTSRIMKRVKTMFDSTPSTGELEDLYSRRAVYVDDKARRVLGYQPRYDLQRGIAMSVLWMSRSGYFEGPVPETVRVLEPVHVQTAETVEYRESAAAAN